MNSLTNLKQGGEQEGVSFSWKFKKIYIDNICQWLITSPSFSLYGYQLFNLKISGIYTTPVTSYELKLELFCEDSESRLEISEIKLKFNNSSTELVFVNARKGPKNCFFSERKFSGEVLTVLKITKYDISVKIFCNLVSPDLQFLGKDFDSLLKSENYADFSIKVGDVNFKTHKNILSCRSKVLSRMIETDMVEKRTNKVDLSHWNPNIVKEMLNYVYTGKCAPSIHTAHELFKLAHFLDIAGLQAISKRFMLLNIETNNIADILDLTVSDQYDLVDLREKAMSFVSENESLCVKNTKVIDHLCNHLSIDNIVVALEMSKKYALQNLLLCAMKFVRQNYKLIVKTDKTRNYLKTEGDLFLQIFESSLDHHCSCVKTEDD